MSSSAPRTTSPRPYRSPLRDAQANQTRTLILDAFTALLADGSGDVPVRRLAEEAGVSERTVYRYFPDRDALVDGMWDLLAERAGTDHVEASLHDIWDVCDIAPDVFASFDADAAATKASLLLDPDPAHDLPSQRRRTERFGELIAATFPALDDTDVNRLAGVVRTLTSSMTWLRLREQFGLAGRDSGELAGWALRCVLREVERTGRVGPPPE